MGRYDKAVLEEGIEVARTFLMQSSNDKYTILYWLCTYWMLIAAIESGTYYFNAQTANTVWANDSIGQYRNSYAHSMLDVFNKFDKMRDSITFDMCNYDEYTAKACVLLGIFPQP